MEPTSSRKGINVSELREVLVQLDDEVYAMLPGDERLMLIVTPRPYITNILGNLVSVRHVDHKMWELAFEDMLSYTRRRGYTTIQPTSKARRVDFVTEIRGLDEPSLHSVHMSGRPIFKAEHILIAPPPPSTWDRDKMYEEAGVRMNTRF